MTQSGPLGRGLSDGTLCTCVHWYVRGVVCCSYAHVNVNVNVNVMHGAVLEAPLIMAADSQLREKEIHVLSETMQDP